MGRKAVTYLPTEVPYPVNDQFEKLRHKKIRNLRHKCHETEAQTQESTDKNIGESSYTNKGCVLICKRIGLKAVIQTENEKFTPVFRIRIRFLRILIQTQQRGLESGTVKNDICAAVTPEK